MNKHLLAQYFLLIGATASTTNVNALADAASAVSATAGVVKTVEAAGKVAETVNSLSAAAGAASVFGKIIITLKTWSNWGWSTLTAGKNAAVSFIYLHPYYTAFFVTAACGTAGAVQIQKKYFPTESQLREQILENNFEALRHQLYILLTNPAKFNYGEVQVLALSLGIVLAKKGLLEQHGNFFVPVRNWIGLKKINQDVVDALNVAATYKNGGIIENALVYDAYLKSVDILRNYCAPSFWKRARDQMAAYGLLIPAEQPAVVVVREDGRVVTRTEQPELEHIHYEEMTLEKLQKLTQKEITQFINYLEKKLADRAHMSPRDLAKYSTYETLLKKAKQLVQK